jgi:hypothetical protein
MEHGLPAFRESAAGWNQQGECQAAAEFACDSQHGIPFPLPAPGDSPRKSISMEETSLYDIAQVALSTARNDRRGCGHPSSPQVGKAQIRTLVRSSASISK